MLEMNVNVVDRRLSRAMVRSETLAIGNAKVPYHQFRRAAPCVMEGESDQMTGRMSEERLRPGEKDVPKRDRDRRGASFRRDRLLIGNLPRRTWITNGDPK